jgi:hypothetical protein
LVEPLELVHGTKTEQFGRIGAPVLSEAYIHSGYFGNDVIAIGAQHSRRASVTLKPTFRIVCAAHLARPNRSHSPHGADLAATCFI